MLAHRNQFKFYSSTEMIFKLKTFILPEKNLTTSTTTSLSCPHVQGYFEVPSIEFRQPKLWKEAQRVLSIHVSQKKFLQFLHIQTLSFFRCCTSYSEVTNSRNQPDIRLRVVYFYVDLI